MMAFRALIGSKRSVSGYFFLNKTTDNIKIKPIVDLILPVLSDPSFIQNKTIVRTINVMRMILKVFIKTITVDEC